MNDHTIKLTAPSAWASYLINGDDSGLEANELKACHAWMAFENIGFPINCQDAGFIWKHDAIRFALAADCQTYTFEA